MKAQVIDFFTANRANYPTKSKAAAAIAGKLVPSPYDTVRDWLKGI